MNKSKNMINSIIQGDTIEVLRGMPDNFIHCAITSPPYFGLRDYLHEEQMGREEHYQDYVDYLVEMGKELKRVLRNDGNYFLNIGDKFCNHKKQGLKPKDKMLIPSRVAIALQDEAGFYVRGDYIWAKPSVKPTPASDRLMETKEYLFHLTPSSTYHFDLDSIRKPHKDISIERVQYGNNPGKHQSDDANKSDVEVDSISRTKKGVGKENIIEKIRNGETSLHPLGANPGDIIEVAPETKLHDTHFAPFPEELISDPIKAGCPQRVCKKCGKPYERPDPRDIDLTDDDIAKEITGSRGLSYKIPKPVKTCDCNTDEWEPGIVLDPFMGCYDEETRVMTKEGLKYFNNIKDDDEIMTLNPDTYEIEYHVPSKKFKYFYSGKIFSLKHKNLDLLVTPEHNLYLSSRAQDREYKFRRPDSLTNENYYAPAGISSWAGEKQEIFHLPKQEFFKIEKVFECERCGHRMIPNKRDNELKWPRECSDCRSRNVREVPAKNEEKYHSIDMRDWVRFLALYLSEGNRRGEFNVFISQKKQREGFEEILRNLPFTFRRIDDEKWNKHGWDISSKDLSCYLSKFGTAKEKYIPSQIKNLTQDYLKEFLDFYRKGDGSKDEPEISTSSEQMRDDLNEIALKLGYSTSWRVLKMKRGSKEFINYMIWLGSSKERRISPSSHLSKIDYDGYVYDLRVPNHIMMVERNGKLIWCGNSGTTGVVAKRLNRRWIGIDISEDYIEMAKKRINNTSTSIDRFIGSSTGASKF